MNALDRLDTEEREVRAAAGKLAEVLLDSDDPYAALEALQPLLTPEAWQELCAAMEACPTHVCDERICADDEDVCDVGRSARAARKRRAEQPAPKPRLREPSCWEERVVDEEKAEADPCERNTDGCCIDHAAEFGKGIDGSCECY